MESFIGTILMVAFNFAPIDWLPCDGRQLAISEFQPLFALIGTTYGGNGQTTFALPDLRGRMPVGMGNGPGLTPRMLGQMFGMEGTKLTAGNLPAHTHTLAASDSTTGLTQVPAANWSLGGPSFGGRTPTAVDLYSTATGTVASAPTSPAGSTNPAAVETIPPAACLNFIICYNGIFPSRP